MKHFYGLGSILCSFLKQALQLPLKNKAVLQHEATRHFSSTQRYLILLNTYSKQLEVSIVKSISANRHYLKLPTLSRLKYQETLGKYSDFLLILVILT